ncbi:MAG TPA: hypothetical protein VFH73_26385 [Polyangia bacterium]|jgi:hypothetical protein|nr:hypothetical protein [Polyangia bacterium]
MRTKTTLTLTLLTLCPLASCSSSANSCGANPARYSPQIVPSDFSTTIDNKYLTYLPGRVMTFTRTDGNIVEQHVMTETKMIMGVKTVVVHDFLKTPAGQLLEDTYDYYAQDKAGNVWYFGEDTKAYSGTIVSTKGAWLSGANCAMPGIVMLANPQVGASYRQEYLAGEAEDEAEVVSLNETVTVPYGTLGGCIETREQTALAPGDVENKYYCAGIGIVRSKDVGTIDKGSLEDLATIDGKKQDCTSNPAKYDPPINPADFSATIDNKYLPFKPGSVFSYVQSSGDLVEQDVLYETKMVMGVTTVIVHDFLKSPEGDLLEDTYDYFAQDKAGNVWYFGEDTKAYSGTQVSTKGTWAGGLNCARPGIVMGGSPKVGDSYRQEYLPGEAEDQAEVVSLIETVTVPYGTLSNCLKTKEYTVLAPGDIENKYYCPGIGLILSADIGTIDSGKKEELTRINGVGAGGTDAGVDAAGGAD